MDFKYCLHVFIVGMAIFSMFFGGGNLAFPLWVGSETSSLSSTSLGFIASGVLLPCFGIVVSLLYNGDYERYLGLWGKTIGNLFTFSLLLFWIPLGSGPRCNILAHGAYACQFGAGISLWVYSAIYSIIVYTLTYKKNRSLKILGSMITPLLVSCLFFLVYSVFTQNVETSMQTIPAGHLNWSDFFSSLIAGYNTMDFIAAIFFSSMVIALIKEKQGEKFDLRFVRNACFVAITLLSVVYIGMIFVGNINTNVLIGVPRDQLLTTVGQTVFNTNLQIVIFVITTLSVLSTSMALALVFSEYLKKTVFKEAVSHKICLFISVFSSFLLSTIGFDKLAILISYAMSTLYPMLLLLTITALIAKIRERAAKKMNLNHLS